LLKASSRKKWEFINSASQEKFSDFAKMDIFEKLLYQSKLGLMFAKEHPEYHELSRMFLKEKGNDIYDKAIEVLDISGQQIMDNLINDAIDKKEISTKYTKAFIRKILGHLFSSFDDIFDSRQSIESMEETLEEYVEFIKCGLTP
jgi:hypothetical protein